MLDPSSLSPIHRDLIEAARMRTDRRLIPPERVRGRARRLLGEKLIGLGLAETVADHDATWWSDSALGPTGLRLVADVNEHAGADKPVGEGEDAASAQPVEPQSWTKIARVLALLRRPDGADIAALVAATDWLPHTARAALTGLRRKGHAIETRREDGRTIYRIAQAGSPPSDREMADASLLQAN